MSQENTGRSYTLDDYTKHLEQQYGAFEFDFGTGTVSMTRFAMLTASEREVVGKLRRQLVEKQMEVGSALERQDTSFDYLGGTDEIVRLRREILESVGKKKAFVAWLSKQPDAGVEWLYDKYERVGELGEASPSSESLSDTGEPSSLTSGSEG